MPEYLTPGVYFEFVDAAPPAVFGTRVDVCGIIGIAQKGPLHQPVRIESWRQFQAVYLGISSTYAHYSPTPSSPFSKTAAAALCYPVRVASL